jgi:pyruvate, orthophosphate dikinase
MIVRIEEATGDQVEKLGMKGAYLGDMARLGLDVPPGFIVTTDACGEFYSLGRSVPSEIFEDIKKHIGELESKTGRTFGGGSLPLLLSLRSGAAVPMPGMMDTILNLGMNSTTLQALIGDTRDERFVYDSFSRFVKMYGRIIFGIEPREFDDALQYQLDRAGADSSIELNIGRLKKLIESYHSIIRRSGRGPIPEDPYEQLRDAVEAVFLSWNSPRARVFRDLRRVSDSIGTAIVAQAMVFGNRDENSAVGTVTTRDPIIGMKRLFGEYLPNGQGEEIDEGLRSPRSISELEEQMPAMYEQLRRAAETLEKRYGSVQEIEFTIESGRLFFLQTRPAECTAHANIKFAVDMVGEGLLNRNEAILRVKPESLDQILHRYIDPKVQIRSLARGLAASPGAAYGLAAFDSGEALRLRKENKEAILVRLETHSEDAPGIEAAAGLLIVRGGRSSHAALIARRMGKPCVTGCAELEIDLEKKQFSVGETVVREGDAITVDGSSGRVFLGTVPMRETTIGDEFRTLLAWADEVRTLRIRANADTPEDAERGKEFGAEGIGLCRTEAMFMAADRLPVMQALVLSEEQDEQKKVLDKLQKIQKQDFIEIFHSMAGRPVVFRLLDPPLHEFIPEPEPLMMDVYEMRGRGAADEAVAIKEALLRRVLSHREVNPMLGLRGVRLCILRPEIVRMQVAAIFEAACESVSRNIAVKPEILVPLVGHVNELILVRGIIEETAARVMREKAREIEYTIGALIEIPRAALTAADLARHADFFSFGTNDLTQTTFALSRDDSEHKFLLNYLSQRILDDNPFQTLDPDGVGRLIRIAVEDGRGSNPELELGLCGEQGADPATIAFCHEIGIDYVSCAPYQVPIARLAAAQAKIRKDAAAGIHS